MKKGHTKNIKGIFIALLLIVLIVFIVIKYSPDGNDVTINEKEYSSINEGSDSCLSCHDMTQGFSNFHNPDVIGCAACHLGNPQEKNKEQAHKGMILIPGNLSDAKETCGQCHRSQLEKVNKSLMTTNSGIVAVDKYIFGEADSLDYHYHIKNIQNSPSEKHLRDLCANCHLGAEKKEFGAINEQSRGGGCNACHLNYSTTAEKQLFHYLDSNKKNLPKVHPSTNVFMDDTHCFGCHSRSSRISTNYQGWHETLLEKEDVVTMTDYKVFEDQRVYKRMTEDVHHNRGMLCIDCHSSHEVMGDGISYSHEEQAVKLQCSDCHFHETPNTTTYEKIDQESKMVYMHRKYDHKEEGILVAKKDGHPLINTYFDGDKAYLVGKKKNKLFELKPQSKVCSNDNAHSDLNCSSCHSAWAPRCIGCHTSFDSKDPEGFDLLDKKEVVGQWNEYVSDFLVSYPTLGVRTHNAEDNSNSKTIEPAIPGMIMTLDIGSYDKGSASDSIAFHRLYAPNSPHTTTKAVRSCNSCHTDPIALGFGAGELDYKIVNGEGNWEFTPDYAYNENDGLPEDAWVGFLNDKNQNKNNTTRHDFRPFTVKEQQRILLVGSCLQCHDSKSKVMERSIKDFSKTLKERLSKCIVPNWSK